MVSKQNFNISESKKISSLFESLVRELNNFNDVRSLIPTLHTRIEFLLEKMLCLYFFIEEDIKRDNLIEIIQEFSFNKKFELVKKLDLLTDILILKVSEVHKVRNICVHNIDYLPKIKILNGLSLNFFNLIEIKTQSADILINLNDCLANLGI